MKRVQNYILAQAANKSLLKEDALTMLKELFENQNKTVKTDDIAIVGMSCRFPDANGIGEFWDNMVNGVNSIREFPEIRKKDVDKPIRDYFKGKRNAPEINYRQGAYLDRIDLFDAEYFNITPAEARCMDPLQRLFLEVTWEALEDAGYTHKELFGSRTGVYVGDTDAEYIKLIQNMEPYALPGNTISVIASRIAYILNLSSGSHLIDTACSASLAAVHHAVKGLMTGDCDMAIAGGLNLTLFPIDEGLEDIGIASPDSIARTFDASANGTVWGEGVGVVVLKTLEKAKKDRDHIYAVIKGSAVNSDGKSNGITAPSALAQTEMIKEAWSNAGVSPETVTYMEAHGTGTNLGDPIEIEGITNAFRSFTDRSQFCALGAVKTNIGHLDTAAGLAGLIKTVLLLKNKKIPATLHFEDPNPHINFVESPVYVNTELIPWEKEEGVLRRAGVSAFGIAGTNCHVVLEEYDENGEESVDKKEREEYIFTLSAKSKASFNKLIKGYLKYFPNTSHSIQNICFTSNQCRGHYAYRLAIVASTIEELQKRLELFNSLNDRYRSLPEEGIFYSHLNRREDRQYKLSATTAIETILEEYIKGSEINWGEMYDLKLRRRVPLPVYQFSGNRYWIDYIPEHDSSPIQIQNEKKDVDQWFYKLDWIENEANTKTKIETSEENWLLFADEEGVTSGLTALMKENKKTPIIVEVASNFKQLNQYHYQIRPNNFEDYLNLLDSIIKSGFSNLKGIMHLWTCTEIRSSLRKMEDLKESQEKGVLSLFYILKALNKYDFSRSLEIRIVSNYANLVVPEDSYVFPEKAPLWGFMKVVAQEYNTYKCSCIDIETIERDVPDVSLEIYNEVFRSESKDFVSAWRNGKRFTQQISREKLASVPKRNINVREGGVYLVAGGAGSVGIETCRYLAQNNKIKLVVVNRMPLPDRQKWEEVLEQDKNSEVGKRIQNLLDLEKMGSEVIYYSVDITDLGETRKMTNEIQSKYGQITGILNATMHLEEENIERQDQDEFVKTMESKIMGTWVLNEVSKDCKLDFFLLYSSVASFLGGDGLGSYAAANAFMDQYAQYQSRRGIEITAIGWSYLEMGATNEQLSDTNVMSLPISTEEYTQVLDKLFKYKLTHPILANIKGEELAKVLTLLNIKFSSDLLKEFKPNEEVGISSTSAIKILEAYRELKEILTSDNLLNDIIQRNVELGAKFVSFEEELHNSLEPKSENSDMKLKNPSGVKVTLVGREDELYSETERKLGQIWGDVLGYETIDIHSDFFENGDSLMLMSVVTKINEQLGMDLPVQVFFQEPTIYALSRWIDEENQNASDEDEIIPILPRDFSNN
ncbi:SDR family NAD(P)-dependent oxidoreductase [Bacillus cereus]|uniref:SDR family NAD(P)-dependent oxidoreductase n=1 Tax=Bacillus cereus TaxID=1396 RepID=UPI001245CE23|nr:SDR family NAD(P)-dependent oxidoreductase [Bacillus cereus]MCU5475457.1 SDR family NAD(P)-dependent oxidoreductase [Bacillus cereus]MCU5614892.1 SDR family NAD(P)-dependent oxidoreductase [Bacillus cereus]